jgi:hypothetical protein
MRLSNAGQRLGTRGRERVRAVVHDRYGPPDVLRLEEVERPVPQGPLLGDAARLGISSLLVVVALDGLRDWER